MKFVFQIMLIFFPLHIFGQNIEDLQLDKNEIIFFKNKIDSINSNFETRSFKSVYSSYSQAICDIFFYKGNLATNVKTDISNGLNMEELKSKYPEGNIKKDQLIVVKINEKATDEDEFILIVTPIEMFASFIYVTKHSFVEAIENHKKLVLKISKSKYSKNSVSAVKINEYFPSKPLPIELQKKISYNSSIMGKEPELEKSTLVYSEVNIDTLDFEQKIDILKQIQSKKIISFCGSDNRSLSNEILKYKLAAATKNYNVFIRSLINIISDNIGRLVDDNISMNNRTKYIFNVNDININSNDFYFGGYFRYINENEERSSLILSSLNKILNTTENENGLNEILKITNNKELDLYNRYSFLILAHRLNKSSNSKEMYESNLIKINNAAELFPIGLAEKLVK